MGPMVSPRGPWGACGAPGLPVWQLGPKYGVEIAGPKIGFHDLLPNFGVGAGAGWVAKAWDPSLKTRFFPGCVGMGGWGYPGES